MDAANALVTCSVAFGGTSRISRTKRANKHNQHVLYIICMYRLQVKRFFKLVLGYGDTKVVLEIIIRLAGVVYRLITKPTGPQQIFLGSNVQDKQTHMLTYGQT